MIMNATRHAKERWHRNRSLKGEMLIICCNFRIDATSLCVTTYFYDAMIFEAHFNTYILGKNKIVVRPTIGIYTVL